MSCPSRTTRSSSNPSMPADRPMQPAPRFHADRSARRADHRVARHAGRHSGGQSDGQQQRVPAGQDPRALDRDESADGSAAGSDGTADRRDLGRSRLRGSSLAVDDGRTGNARSRACGASMYACRWPTPAMTTAALALLTGFYGDAMAKPGTTLVSWDPVAGGEAGADASAGRAPSRGAPRTLRPLPMLAATRRHRQPTHDIARRNSRRGRMSVASRCSKC